MVLMVVIALVLFLTDWFCKNKISFFKYAHKLPLFFFGGRIKLGLVKNTGLLLGKGKKHPRLVLWLPAFVLLFTLLLLPYVRRSALPARLGYGLVFGGGANNLLDRLCHGCVTDYINFPRIKRIRNLYFNLSDFGIFLGIILFLLFF